MPERRVPYLSVVTTTRNDNHGGNPLGRFQAFVNCLAAQCRRVNLDAELIVVEWNPPSDRPPISDALAWPAGDTPLEIRIIQVPATLHATLKHAEALPLFQMIGKNVGIRRARGEHVLSTNIDILPTNELIDYIAAGNLRSGHLYRVDRHDVDMDVPVDASLDSMMAYCRMHQLRKHTRWGSFPIASAGAARLFPEDIVEPETGLALGDGWHVMEGTSDFRYRWVSEEAEVSLDESIGSGRLNVEFESNPYNIDSVVEISVVDDDERALLEPTQVSGPLIIQIVIPRGVSRRLRFRGRAVLDARDTLPVFEDRDGLIYRVRRLWWEAGELSGNSARVDWQFPLDRWMAADGAGAQVAITAKGVAVVTGDTRLTYAAEYPRLVAPAAGTYRFWLTTSFDEGDVLVQALSGDRSRFLATSTNYCTGPGRRVSALTVTLDANESFFIVVSNFHRLDNMASRFTIYDLVGDHPCDAVLPPEPLAAMPTPVPVAEPVSIERRSSLAFARRVIRRAQRRLHYDRRRAPALVERIVERVVEAPAGYEELVAAYRRLTPLTHLAPLETLRQFLKTIRPDRLHTNACGDFQLMSRDDWFELRGFAEFELYSMNVDCLFCHTAHYAGMSEHVFQAPSCVFHIEHEIGSGWTPEGGAKLRQRMAERGIGWLDHTIVSMLASVMKWVNRPMIFNGSNWGFGGHELPEIVLDRQSREWRASQ